MTIEEQQGHLDKRWEKTFTEMNVLKAEWMITRRCNLKCSYCKIIDKSTLKGKESSIEELIEIVKMFGELWPGAPMVVYGGEPTVRNDLPDLLAAGKAAGVKLPVISNSIRVMKDPKYAKALVDAGLDNWSVSMDGLGKGQMVDYASTMKSIQGLAALLMFRDKYGIRDLVTCTTVTKHNIDALPEILQAMTAEGVHSIFTPLHIGGPGYEYGQGSWDDMPSQEQIDRISPVLYEMVASGKYLCSNDAGWFNAWPPHFRKQDWMCFDKGLVTIDADGSLKYCVDIPFRPEDRMHALELKTEEGRQKFLGIIKKGPPCHGCLWNPAYECIKRARDPEIGIEDGRQRSRHYLDQARLPKLYGDAGRFFIGNPELKRVTGERHVKNISSDPDDRSS